MIARTWQATATADGAQKYRQHFITAVQPTLTATDGFHGATLLERDGDEATEIQVVTLWESLDAIHAFAGSDIAVAVVEPAADAALVDYDRTVRHFEVTAKV